MGKGGRTDGRIAYDHPKMKAVAYAFIDHLKPGDMFRMEDFVDFLTTVPMQHYRRTTGRNRDNPNPVGTREGTPLNRTAQSGQYRESLTDGVTYFAPILKSHPHIFVGSFRSTSKTMDNGPYFNPKEVFYCKTDEALNWVCVECEKNYQIEASDLDTIKQRKVRNRQPSFRHIIECSDCYDRYLFRKISLEAERVVMDEDIRAIGGVACPKCGHSIGYCVTYGCGVKE